MSKPAQVDRAGFTLITYASDDGLKTEVLWNARPGPVPEFITLADGTTAQHQFPDDHRGPGFTPPAGMRHIVDWTPPPPRLGSSVALGWPGTPSVTGG